MPRSVLDLQLSKSLSKSDSNLVAVSPIQVSLLFISLSSRCRYFGKHRKRSSQLNRSPNWAKMFPAVQHFKTGMNKSEVKHPASLWVKV